MSKSELNCSVWALNAQKGTLCSKMERLFPFLDIMVWISDVKKCPKTELFCSDFRQMPKTEPSGTGPKVYCPKSERIQISDVGCIYLMVLQ